MTSLSRRRVLAAGAAWALAPAAVSFAQSKSEPTPKKDPYADAKFIAGEPPKPAKGAFTVVVLPDTQFYCRLHPDQFYAQTAWIVDQIKDRNIAAVLQLGDITDQNTPKEWEVASKALSALDGKVPYFFTVGNHDLGEGGRCADRTTRLNEYLPLEKYRGQPTFGGVYDREPEKMENNVGLFSAEGRDFAVIALEFGPRKDVVRWANEMAAKHRQRAAILITHAYMYHDETRYDFAKFGTKQGHNPHTYALAKTSNDDIHDGEELWQSLVSRHENFVMTLNGHVLGDGLARLSTRGAKEQDVPQVLVNFQMKPNGGDGWLRLLEFQADGKTVEVHDYSPTLKQRNESEQNRFRLQLPT